MSRMYFMVVLLVDDRLQSPLDERPGAESTGSRKFLRRSVRGRERRGAAVADGRIEGKGPVSAALGAERPARQRKRAEFDRIYRSFSAHRTAAANASARERGGAKRHQQRSPHSNPPV